MLNVLGLVDATVSHAMATGRFEQVNGHEPANAPASGGLTAAVWADRVQPVRSSGLDSVSVLVVLNVRLYTVAQAGSPESRDQIDPDLLAAVDDLCAAYSGDFTLGGIARNIDIFGANGSGLDVRAGYVQQSEVLYRVMTISLPILVNDLWEESA